MKVVADLCIVPMGVGPSVSSYVREIKAILEASGLNAEMHANGTNIEGELADICRLIELCEDRLSQIGVQRVFLHDGFLVTAGQGTVDGRQAHRGLVETRRLS